MPWIDGPHFGFGLSYLGFPETFGVHIAKNKTWCMRKKVGEKIEEVCRLLVEGN